MLSMQIPQQDAQLRQSSSEGKILITDLFSYKSEPLPQEQRSVGNQVFKQRQASTNDNEQERVELSHKINSMDQEVRQLAMSHRIANTNNTGDQSEIPADYELQPNYSQYDSNQDQIVDLPQQIPKLTTTEKEVKLLKSKVEKLEQDNLQITQNQQKLEKLVIKM